MTSQSSGMMMPPQQAGYYAMAQQAMPTSETGKIILYVIIAIIAIVVLVLVVGLISSVLKNKGGKEQGVSGSMQTPTASFRKHS